MSLSFRNTHTKASILFTLINNFFREVAFKKRYIKLHVNHYIPEVAVKVTILT